MPFVVLGAFVHRVALGVECIVVGVVVGWVLLRVVQGVLPFWGLAIWFAGFPLQVLWCE